MPGNGRVIAVVYLIEDGMIELMARANEAGFSSEEVLQAMELIVRNARIALEEDLDPADDPA